MKGNVAWDLRLPSLSAFTSIHLAYPLRNPRAPVPQLKGLLSSRTPHPNTIPAHHATPYTNVATFFNNEIEVQNQINQTPAWLRPAGTPRPLGLPASDGSRDVIWGADLLPSFWDDDIRTRKQQGV